MTERESSPDHYDVGGSTEVVLTCADCGETGPIAGIRWNHGFGHSVLGRPADPLCEVDFGIEIRVWGESRGAKVIGPPVRGDGSPEDPIAVRRTCPRCGGAGRVKGYEGVCFQCIGARYTYVVPREVRRTERWTGTFQSNRTKGVPDA